MTDPILDPATEVAQCTLPSEQANDSAASFDAVDTVDEIDSDIASVPLIESFSELNLSQRVLESVNAAGFTKPTPIQAQFIPLALTGQDVRGQAKTGTGKTGSFLIPIFERLKANDGRPKAIILAPTRELALQIQGEIVRLGSLLGFTSVTLYGGSSYEPQIEALAKGVDIIVGTPGRIMDHMYSKRLDLSGIQIAVLDEADRMLDLGFRKDIEYILKHSPSERQTLLLSATIPEEIKRLSKRFMRDPLEIRTSSETLTVDAIEQFYTTCERTEKLAVLLKILDIENPPLAIIFCGTKIGAKKLAEKLKKLYISAREIHGDLQQARREKIMDHFRSGKVQLLIATDVASRGIDVNDITHIINYDIPYKIDDYVHRIGRTGRIGKKGRAFTLVTRDEAEYLTDIEQLINRELINISFPDLTSRWWPTPPSTPPEGYEVEQVSAAEAAPVVSHQDRQGKSGSSGGKGKPRRKTSSSEPRSSSSEKSKESPSSQSSKTAPAAPKMELAAPAQLESSTANTPEKAPRTAAPKRQSRNKTPRVVLKSVAEVAEIVMTVFGQGTAGLYNPEAAAAATEDGYYVPLTDDAVRPDGDTTHEESAKPHRKDRSSSASKDKQKNRTRGEPIHIVCSACGQAATVRFKPDPNRAVFCQTCYKIEKEKKTEAVASDSNSDNSDNSGDVILPLSHHSE